MSPVESRALSGGTAIVGVGASRFGRLPEESVLTLIGEALVEAVRDAGIDKERIDGLLVQTGSPRGADYDTIAQVFGLTPRFCSQTWSHGRFTATVLTHAALAVSSGLADCVACVTAAKNSTVGRLGEANHPLAHEQLREAGGPHGEEAQIGMSSPIAGAALGFSAYCRRYGIDRELLGEIPITFRRHARLNPRATERGPMTQDDYRQSRPIIDPLRLFDCSLVSDGAVCAIVTRRDLVPDARRAAWITGAQGIQAGRDTFIFAPVGLGVAQQSTRRRSLAQARELAVYRMAGCRPEDVDVLGIYDSFSALPVYALEDFGFCAPGDALSWIQGGRIGLGGEIPVNTNGGQLSEAQMNGWGQIRELVMQLRGEAGERQVADARRAMWLGVGGDALMFERE